MSITAEFPVFPVLDVCKRMRNADLRYGEFASTHEALGVASEEWDELRLAIQQNDLASIASEAMDLAAVCMRLAIACTESVNFKNRSGK